MVRSARLKLLWHRCLARGLKVLAGLGKTATFAVQRRHRLRICSRAHAICRWGGGGLGYSGSAGHHLIRDRQWSRPGPFSKLLPNLCSPRPRPALALIVAFSGPLQFDCLLLQPLDLLIGCLAGRGHALTLPRLHLLIFLRLPIDRLEKYGYVVLILTVAARSAMQAKSQQDVLVREVRARDEHGVAAEDSHENSKLARQSIRGM